VNISFRVALASTVVRHSWLSRLRGATHGQWAITATGYHK